MPLDPLRLNADDTWRWLTRVAVYFAAYAFGSAAILLVGLALLNVGAEALHWFNTGSWNSIETIAGAWPSAAAHLKIIDWIFLRDIGLWVMTQSVSFAYFGLGIVCLLICALFMQLNERIEMANSIRNRSDLDW